MGMLKTLMDHDGVVVRFDCPNTACDNVVEGPIDGATFDVSAEYVSDGEDSTQTNIECDECHETFTVESLASAVGTSYSVIGHPDMVVSEVMGQMNDDEAFDRRPPGQ